MSSDETICPACGHHSKDPDWCDDCGAQLSTAEPEPRADGWLTQGELLELHFPVRRLTALRGLPETERVSMVLEVGEVVDDSSSQRTSLASLVSAADSRGEDLSGHMGEVSLFIEELSPELSEDPPEIPDSTAGVLRTPLASLRRGERRVHVHADEGYLTVEELVMRHDGAVPLDVAAHLFSAILQSVDAIHRAGYVSLRLSPWTVLVHPSLAPAADVRPGLGDEVTHSEPGGAEDDALFAPSEPEVTPTDATATLDDGSPQATPLGEVDPFEETAELSLSSIKANLEATPEEAASGEEEKEKEEEAVAEDASQEETSEGADDEEAEASDAAEGEQPDQADGEEEEGDEGEEAPAAAGGIELEIETGPLDIMIADEAPTIDALPEHPAFEQIGVGDERTDEEEEPGFNVSGTIQGGFSYVDMFRPSADDPEPAPEDTLPPPPGALIDAAGGLFAISSDADEIPVVMGFSPPEMFGRTRAEITEACDIFSLGMLLYYITAGVLPPTSVYTRHIPALPMRNFRPDFPLGIQSVISRATRPDPTERHSDVLSMNAAFDRAVSLVTERLQAIDSPRITKVRVAADRHIGIAKKRRNPVNQDSVFAKTSEDGVFSLIVVADGVSTASYGSGDLASQAISAEAELAWEELLPRYLMDEPVDEFEAIFSILERANKRIVDHVNAHHTPFSGNPHEVMGTTALVAIVHRGLVTLGSLGDSRGYLQRGTAFEQITIDHNLWTLSVLDGVPADSALSLPHGDALARCLGTFYVDSGQLVAVPPQPDMFRFPVAPGDTLLLTTDGLLDFAGTNQLVAEDNVLSILLTEPNPDLACLEMIVLANRGGGGDNIGLSIARFT
jgi:protein phosphatase